MITLLILLICYFGLLILVGRMALYPPRSPIFLSPSTVGVRVEDIEFDSSGFKLRGWWVPHAYPRGIAILLHGYVMNRAENAGLAATLHRHGFACLLFDFRASGHSDGKKVGIGWLERSDVLAACEFAKHKLPNRPIVVIGSSMGAAAGAFAAAECPNSADALVLDSCYNSLPKATLGWWRFLGGRFAAFFLAPVVLAAWPIAGFNPFRANVGSSLKDVSIPVLLLHGSRDNLVDPSHAYKNFSCNPKNELVIFEGASHSEARWVQPDRYFEVLVRFLDSVPVFRERGTAG